MNIKDIKTLAQDSFTKGNLDEAKVTKIVKVLEKKDLRQYIKAIKLINSKNTVKVFTSAKSDEMLSDNLKGIFKYKKIVVEKNDELIAGIKIEDFDNIYELNLKNTLDLMVNYIKE